MSLARNPRESFDKGDRGSGAGHLGIHPRCPAPAPLRRFWCRVRIEPRRGSQSEETEGGDGAGPVRRSASGYPAA